MRGNSPHRVNETGSLRTPPTAKQSGQSRQGGDEGGFYVQFPVVCRSRCNTRRAGRAHRATIIGPGLVSRFPGGAVAPTASQWVFSLRYSGHRWPFGPIIFTASAERGRGTLTQDDGRWHDRADGDRARRRPAPSRRRLASQLSRCEGTRPRVGSSSVPPQKRKPRAASSRKALGVPSDFLVSRGDTCDQHADAPVMRRYYDTQRALGRRPPPSMDSVLPPLPGRVPPRVNLVPRRVNSGQWLGSRCHPRSA